MAMDTALVKETEIVRQQSHGNETHLRSRHSALHFHVAGFIAVISIPSLHQRSRRHQAVLVSRQRLAASDRTAHNFTHRALHTKRHTTSKLPSAAHERETQSSMAQSKGLTASGLLYEGSDYQMWLDTLRPILMQHFPGLSIRSSGHPAHAYQVCVPPNVRRSDVCDGIWWHVSPHVRSRVSEKERVSPTNLLSVLRHTARPFRFMDLPAEIRLKVYQLELAAKTSQHTSRLLRPVLGAFEYRGNTISEPLISSVSRQIRVEALPVYYRGVSFDLLFNDRIFTTRALNIVETRTRRAQHGMKSRPRPTNVERVCAVNKWASALKMDSIRLLRNISVQLPLLAICSHDQCEDMLRLSLRMIGGKPELKVAPHMWLKPDSQKLLRDHASAISSLAHTLKLEGEALIMFLTSRPDIWDQLELADK